MITLLSAKFLSMLAVVVGLNSPAMASDLELVNPQAPTTSETLYKIDESAQPVVVGWNASRPKALLVAIHGLGLHKRAFEKFALAMKDDGISTYALDVRGFGGWSLQKKRIDFDATAEDINSLVEMLRQTHPNKPVFLIGESMGGAIALEYAAKHPDTVDGVISSVPSYDRRSKFGTTLFVGTSALLTGGQHVSLKTALVNQVFHNKELQQKWERDPDSRLSLKLTDLLRFTKFMKQSRQSISKIYHIPVLIVQGEQDRLIKPEATEKLFRELPTGDKQMIELSKNEHLVFEDGQFDDSVISQVQGWLLSHADTRILSASIAKY